MSAHISLCAGRAVNCRIYVHESDSLRFDAAGGACFSCALRKDPATTGDDPLGRAPCLFGDGSAVSALTSAILPPALSWRRRVLERGHPSAMKGPRGVRDRAALRKQLIDS